MSGSIDNAVVIDVETSGTNPFRHSVLSVALVPLVDPRSRLNVHVRPPSIEWSEFAERNFERFRDDWAANAVSPRAACDQIEEYLESTFGGQQVIAVGHNIGFDIAFTRQLASLGDRSELRGLSHRALDTHTMLYLLCLNGQTPWSVLSSDGAFTYFGIRIPDSARHTALGDALATRELVTKILSSFNGAMSPPRSGRAD